MKSLRLLHSLKGRLPRRQHSELGASLIMIYLSILIFLYIAILFLDIPYLERVGRSIQRTADAAALAGAIQLTERSAMMPDGITPDQNARKLGWRKAKRAVFKFLAENPIKSAENLNFAALAGNWGSDPLDPGTYQYQEFTVTGGGQTAVITIHHAVYERPFRNIAGVWTWTNGPVMYPIEVGDVANRNTPANTCKQNGSGLPTACAPIPPVEDVADTMRVTITVSGIPTLFAKLLGFNSYTTISRTALSVPE